MNRWLEEHRTLVLVVVGLLLVASIGSVAIRYRPPAPINVIPPGPTGTLPPTATPGPLHVYVSGAVAQPEVYEVPAGALVQDAVAAAGGPTSDADLARVNLARDLIEGDHVHIPRIGEASTPVPGETITPTPPWPININTADLDMLDLLPGIGPALAQRIIDYREANGPFQSIEQIQNVSGIGPAKFDEMRDYIVVCDEC